MAAGGQVLAGDDLLVDDVPEALLAGDERGAFSSVCLPDGKGHGAICRRQSCRRLITGTAVVASLLDTAERARGDVGQLAESVRGVITMSPFIPEHDQAPQPPVVQPRRSPGQVETSEGALGAVIAGKITVEPSAVPVEPNVARFAGASPRFTQHPVRGEHHHACDQHRGRLSVIDERPSARAIPG